MKAIRTTILPLFLIAALTACGSFAPRPTETPVPSATSLPTATFTAVPTITATATEKPTQTPVPPSATPTEAGLPLPSGTPMSSWEGFPIMPEAIAGAGDSASYSFTVKAAPEEVQKFYEKALARLGWDMLASGQGETNSLLLIFMKGSGMLTLSVIPQPDGLVYVLLVK